ncbi:hypothetical protein BDF21DRAFT_24368 [Thamnidium elegans]|nr:hypothetical protein BDF21DRAFT_24368 [Thamnidium elegans]
MHEFSLEKVGILQYGYKVKMRSCLIKELYDHMTPKQPTLINAFHGYEKDIALVFSSKNEVEFIPNLKQFKHKYDQDNEALFISKILKLLMEVPINARKQLWIKKSEANYSEYFIWQLFKIATKYSSNNSLCFEIGEYKLESIKHEIDRRSDEKLKACSYNADGSHTGSIGGKTVELSLLEVTGAFGFSDIARSIKYHIKGSFDALSLLQETAHLFEFGSLDTFHQIRVYFIQALEEKIRVWSLEQTSQGVCIMELIETANISTKFEDSEIFMRDVTNIFIA